MLKTGPTPPLIVACYPNGEVQRVPPTEKVNLVAICLDEYPCLPGVPINYTWSVQQEGFEPLDLTIHSEQGRASGLDMQTLTLLPGALRPGARMAVEIRGHYAPTTPQAISTYQKEAERYKKYQDENP